VNILERESGEPDETGEIDWRSAPDGSVVCYCATVTKGEIVSAVQNGASSPQEIHEATGAGFGGRCMELNPRRRCCHSDIVQLVKLVSSPGMQRD